MSNETKQAVYDAARAYVGDASSEDGLRAALAAHDADEKPKPKAKPKAAAAQTGTSKDAA